MILRAVLIPRPRRRRGGFTLLEVMMSAAILMVAVVGFYGAFGASNQMAYAARVNTSARIQLDSALAQALTQPWRSEQAAPAILQPTAGWERFALPGEVETSQTVALPSPHTAYTNATLLVDVRRATSDPTAPVPLMRGLLERNVQTDAALSNAVRVSFRLTYGGPDAPTGFRTRSPVIMIVHTLRTRDN